MTDQPLMERLDDLVAGCEREHGDWDEVLARAGVRRAPARRRLVAAGLLLLVLLVALLATPAFGIRSALLGLIGRTDVPFKSGKPAPAVVKRQFEDLSLGAPPAMDPRAIAGQAREVATFESRGKKHVLWVAPTRRGGFCMTFSELFGGCRADTADQGRFPIGLTVEMANARGSAALRIGGEVLAAKTAKIEVEFEDGSSVGVPFVFVSSPIDAGFFLYDVRARNQRIGHRPRAVVARSAAGVELARAAVMPFRGSTRRERAAQPPRKPLEVPPSPPLQRGSDRGVEVVAGRNGVAVFRTVRPVPLLAGSRVGFGCFRLRARDDARGYTIAGRFGTRSTIRLYGVGTPFDGCEVQGGYGHVWPDRLGSHSAVEVAFTAAARRYFADRAAARDLALLVRSRRMQRIRRAQGAELTRALERAYGRSPGKIRYRVHGAGVTFSETSLTGRRFFVEVERGKIKRTNVRPLAFVF